MTQVAGSHTARDCAQELIQLLAENPTDPVKAAVAATASLQKLLQRPDLFDLGVPREGNHTGESLWLYYDYDLSILTAGLPKGTSVPVHNHGTWEIVAVYRGAIKYTMYERMDDRSRRYYSQLQVVEDRIMQPLDVSVCPLPPHDIHGFTALTDDTHIVAVVGGPYSPVREYHRPTERFYIEQHQQAWRLGRQPGS